MNDENKYYYDPNAYNSYFNNQYYHQQPPPYFGSVYDSQGNFYCRRALKPRNRLLGQIQPHNYPVMPIPQNSNTHGKQFCHYFSPSQVATGYSNRYDASNRDSGLTQVYAVRTRPPSIINFTPPKSKMKEDVGKWKAILISLALILLLIGITLLGITLYYEGRMDGIVEEMTILDSSTEHSVRESSGGSSGPFNHIWSFDDDYETTVQEIYI